ncbi:arylamine N-acetyltransferase [Streptomyces sp. NPDC059906]|uniref:arylamine N-acetyltransferase n=1 Tax=Streptomyces sp. NPDC059906 TaxID=3346997 RepID=UPI003664D219
MGQGRGWGGRGGFCYELNGLFGALLTALGYELAGRGCRGTGAGSRSVDAGSRLDEVPPAPPVPPVSRL